MLYDVQKRALFEFGVRWEEIRRVRLGRPEGDCGWVTSSRGEVERRMLLDEIWREYIKLDPPETDAEAQREAETLERFALAVLLREAGGPFIEAYRKSVLAVKPNYTPTTSALASTFFYILLKWDPSLALEHFHIMLDGRRLPTRAIILRLVQENETDTVDLYAVARQILDGKPASGGDSSLQSLESLYTRRIERLERMESINNDPTIAFIQWLGLDKARNVKQDSPTPSPHEREWLLAALRMWETVYGEEEHRRLVVHNLLYKLVSRVCEVEGVASGLSTPISSSPSLEKSVSLALQYLPSDKLVSLSRRLLHATCISLPSPLLAQTLYLGLRRQAPMESLAPFKWSGGTLPELLYLLDFGASRDPAFALRLYYDWTADGFEVLSIRAFRAVYKALGTLGDVRATARIIRDVKESGRRVHMRLYRDVIASACATGRIVRAIKLFNFFQASSDPSAIPVAAYNDMFRLLALARSDRRREIARIFALMQKNSREPDIETWNHLISAHVFRPKIGTADVESAGEVYTQLLKTRCVPNAMTFSLLVHGFVRCAEWAPGPTRRSLLDSAITTFQKSIELKQRITGQHAAGLVRALGVAKRWEDGKSAAERWWASVAREEVENGVLDIAAEMEEMRQTGHSITLLEGKFIDRRVASRRNSGQEHSVTQFARSYP